MSSFLCFELSLTTFLHQHLLNLWLLATRKQIVRRIYIRLTRLIIFFPFCSQVLVPILNRRLVNRLSFLKLISVQLIIFREVNVNKTRQGMPISPYPDITVLISMPVDNLLPYPATFRPIHLVVVLILKSLFQILLQSLGLLSIELFLLC